MSQTVKNIIVNVMVIITKALMSFSWAKSKPSPWFDVFILCLVNRSIPILSSSEATEVHTHILFHFDFAFAEFGFVLLC